MTIRKQSDIGVLALVPDDWENVWTVRHHFLTRICRYCPTVWVNLARDWRAVLHDFQYKGEVCKDSSGLLIYKHSRLLPTIYRPARLGNAIREKRWIRARNLLVREGCSRIILYIWRPQFADALEKIPHDFSVYHIDDEYSFSVDDSPLGEIEKSLICRSNEVIIHSPNLMRKKGDLNENTYVAPNGVDYSLFSSSTEEPTDYQSIPHPRIGCVGVIKTQLDLELLDDIAEKRSDWSIICVGPIGYLGQDQKWLDRLQDRRNVYFLGLKPPNELPAYIQHLDACLMIYKENDYTNSIYPLKLHEYLASGMPVVSSRIRTVMDFQSVICMASSADEWIEQIASAIEPSMISVPMRERRKEVAKNFDWDAIVDKTVSRWLEKLDYPVQSGSNTV